MNDDDLTMRREDMKIEGDRNLYSYTFTDADGKVLKPEPTLKLPKPSPAEAVQPTSSNDQHGNLGPQGEDRKG